MPYFNWTNMCSYQMPVITVPDDEDSLLSASDSGSMILLPQAVDTITITLPPASPGLHYHFFVDNLPDGNNIYIEAPSAGLLTGYVTGVEAGTGKVIGVYLPGFQNLILTGDPDEIGKGDGVEFFCNGFSWYFRAFSSKGDGWTTS